MATEKWVVWMVGLNAALVLINGALGLTLTGWLVSSDGGYQGTSQGPVTAPITRSRAETAIQGAAPRAQASTQDPAAPGADYRAPAPEGYVYDGTGRLVPDVQVAQGDARPAALPSTGDDQAPREAPPGYAFDAEGRPIPGGGPAAPPELQGLPPNAVTRWLLAAVPELARAGETRGVDVSAYIPTRAETEAAAHTGDFFNPTTLAVLRKLRRGFAAVEQEMPPLPEAGPADAFK